ncbi:MAG: hypothetical protein JST00_38330 [Deltaproteobacteria bacterium]|nr:hypothetical protein [Deltaproteobacteria bacterium]
MVTKKDDEPPYARYAFLNPYNLSLFAGGVLLGLLTGHGWLSVLTCAGEAMWLIFAPDSKLLRRLWFDRAFEQAKRQDDIERRKTKIAQLAPNDSMRVAQLCGQKQVIERLARDNPSLAVDLLATELAKLDALLDDFIELGVTAARAEQHAATFDFGAMRRSWHMYEQQLRANRVGDPRREIAEKNLEVLKQRRRRYDDLCRAIQVARGQMELIEQTFKLLGDEIMSMASPLELGGRIEELRVAVDAVRETASDASLAIELEDELDTNEWTKIRSAS